MARDYFLELADEALTERGEQEKPPSIRHTFAQALESAYDEGAHQALQLVVQPIERLIDDLRHRVYEIKVAAKEAEE